VRESGDCKKKYRWAAGIVIAISFSIHPFIFHHALDYFGRERRWIALLLYRRKKAEGNKSVRQAFEL
jgi:hypothetical protein